MATTNQLVDRAKFILSRRNDTTIGATIIAELGLAQERLEQEPWLPNFLYQRQEITATTEEVNLLTAVTRYIRLHHNAGGIYYRSSDPLATEPWVKLKRYDDLDHMIQNIMGPLVSGSTVQGYFMADTLAVLRPYPSVSVPQQLKVHFYQAEANVPAAGNSNLWTLKAGDYLLGEAGLVLAQSLRDKDALAVFGKLRADGKSRLQRKDLADEMSDQTLAMGDED